MLGSTENRKIYQGDGTTTQFAFPYAYLAQADIKVVKRTGTTETTLTLASDYTVSPISFATGGGTVTLLSTPSASATVAIYRDPDPTQTVDLVQGETIPMEATERVLDKLMMAVQRIRSQLDRGAVLHESDTTMSMVLPFPSDRTGHLLGFDSSGRFVPVSYQSVTYPISWQAITNVSASYSITTDDERVVADASASAFTCTLPTAANALSGSKAKVINVIKKDASANVVVLKGSGTETINGVNAQTISYQYTDLEVFSDGSAWYLS